MTKPPRQDEAAVRFTITAVLPAGTLPWATSGRRTMWPAATGAFTASPASALVSSSRWLVAVNSPGGVCVTPTGVGAPDGVPLMPP